MLTYRTSHIYPQWIEDSLRVSASPFYGNLGPSLSNLAPEPIAISPAIVSGELRALLRDTSVLDVATITPLVVSGELRETLRETLKSLSAEADIAASTASVIGGTLKTALITYSANEDVASFSAAVVSGNLS